MTAALVDGMKKLLSLEPQGGPAARRPVLVLGVGSGQRADDAAGIRVAAKLSRLDLPGVMVLEGGTAPENLTGEIKRIFPSHVFIVDCADTEGPPGSIGFIEIERIAGASYGTHSLPLNIFADYIGRETGCVVAVLGIQPRTLELNGAVSAEVEAAIEETVNVFAECLRGAGPRNRDSHSSARGGAPEPGPRPPEA